MIVTLSEFKQFLPEVGNSTSADTALTAQITRSESIIARYLGFPDINVSGVHGPTLDAQTYTFHLDGPSSGDALTLWAPIRPIVSIASIHTDINRQYTSDTLIDASQYTFDGHLGRIYLDPISATKIFNTGFRNIKLIVNAGYTSSTASPELKQAICIYASQLQRNKAIQGRTSISGRGGSVSPAPFTFPPEVKQILQPLRNYGAIL